MPEENEKVEDFISLWKKKVSSENKSPSVIGETLNKVEGLQRENDQLRKKIAENIELISKSEDILKKVVEEKEKLKIEKQEAIMDINIKFNEIEKENAELSSKVKSMVQLLLEKDDEIKLLKNSPQQLSREIIQQSPGVNDAIIEDLQSELSKKRIQISDLENQISELKQENEALLNQQVEEMKSLPIDYVVPVEDLDSNVIKPLPPDTPSKPLEALCQDLQADLNRSKKLIEKLGEEKSQLKQALEDKGFQFKTEDLETLQQENESLKEDLDKLKKSLAVKSEGSKEVEDKDLKIKNLENKLEEKDNIIAQLKLSQPSQKIEAAGPMSELIENLQNNINKLKVIIQEKDQEISELNRRLGRA